MQTFHFLLFHVAPICTAVFKIACHSSKPCDKYVINLKTICIFSLQIRC